MLPRTNQMETETDRISDLPPQILSRIISRFTIRDVVIASVLSRTWKHLCASSKYYLNFTWYTMFTTSQNSALRLRGNTDHCPQYNDLFVKGLNQFLNFYKGTQLVSFNVCFCLGRDSASDIDQWVSFALRKGVEQLRLDLSCRLYPLVESRHIERRNELYIFHPVLLYGGEISKLKLLSLRSCILGPDFHSILYCCLNLESMTLQECCLPVKLCISGSHVRLKSLIIFGCAEMEQIEISASSLTSFEYYGRLIKFSFSSLNLENVSIGEMGKPGVRYIFSKLAKDLPQVKTLLITLPTNWVKYLPTQVCWFYPFSKVEQLKLYALAEMKFDIQKTIIILRACPLLQKFHLVTNCPVNYEQGGISVPTERAHNYLKEVEFGGFYGTRNQIEFALYLLKYARALERTDGYLPTS